MKFTEVFILFYSVFPVMRTRRRGGEEVRMEGRRGLRCIRKNKIMRETEKEKVGEGGRRRFVATLKCV